MDSKDYFDPWTQTVAETLPEPGSSIVVQQLEGIEALDNQFGSATPKCVPENLMPILFTARHKQTTDVHEIQPIRTYAILDASKIHGLEELLIESGLEHCCLFNDDERKNQAPWLVCLEPNNTFTRNLFTDSDAPWHLWRAEPGIYIQTAVELGVLRTHLRLFTRQRIEGQDKWVLFRFWEPNVARHYFTAIATRPEKMLSWFRTTRGQTIWRIIALRTSVNDVWIFEPPNDIESYARPKQSQSLSEVELSALRLFRKEQFAQDLVETFKLKDPYHTSVMGDAALREITRTSYDRARRYGLTQRSTVKLFVHLSLALGASFDKDPMLPWARQILSLSETGQDQRHIAEALRTDFLVYVTRVHGRSGEIFQQFVEALLEHASSVDAQITPQDTQSFVVAYYRAKADYIGPELLRRLVEDTYGYCEDHELRLGKSAFLLTCLRLMYGTECVSDPQYAWIADCINTPPKKGQKDHVFERMFGKFLLRAASQMKDIEA